MAETSRPKNLQSTLAERRERMAAETARGNGEGPQSGFFAWPGRIALMIAVLASPWAFGGVYASAQFLISVCLVIALVCWWMDLALGLRQADLTPLIVLPVLGGLLIAAAQLLPLPRETALALAPLQTELYTQAADPLRPDLASDFSISLDREATWQQARLLVLSLAGLLLGAGLFQRRNACFMFLTLVTLNGVALSVFGLVQKFTWNGKLYWVYQPNYAGLSFGPFVNRNNGAGYLMLCLAAGLGLLVYVWNQRRNEGPLPIVSREIPIWRQWQQHLATQVSEITASKLAVLFANLGIAVALVASLSRGGVIALLLGGITTLVAYGMARRPKTGGLLLLGISGLIALLCSWIGFFDDLSRRFDTMDLDEVATGVEQDVRVQSWTQTLKSQSQVGYLGAGLGAYPSIYRIFSEVRERGIAEYAENQFVQALVDGGIPAFALLIAAVMLLAYSALFLLFRGSSPPTVAIGTAGTFLVSGQVIAGSFDFGWYVPANLILAAVLVGIVAFQSHFLASRLRKATALRLSVPAWAGRLISLGVFALTVLVGLDLFQMANYQAIITRRLDQADVLSLGREVTNREIQLVREMSRLRDGERFARLGALYLHRARLEYFDSITRDIPLADLPEDRRTDVIRNLWEMTHLLRMQERMRVLEEVNGIAGLTNFRAQPFFRDLATAYELLGNSLRNKPVQPENRARMGQLQHLLGNAELAVEHLESAVKLAPHNLYLRRIAGESHLLMGNPTAAAPHFRRLLELAPEDYSKVIHLLLAQTGRINQPVAKPIIAELFLPANPEMLYDFATQHLADHPGLREELLSKADGLLGEVSLTNEQHLLLKANIRLDLGDWEGSIVALESAVVCSPYNEAARLKLAQLLAEHDQLEPARKHAEHLVVLNSRHKPYLEFLSEIRDRLNQRRSGTRPQLE